MQSSFKLSIQNPCAEKFEDFRPTPAGGFCQSCQKEVIDFTKMTDQELIDYYNQNKTALDMHQLYEHMIDWMENNQQASLITD